MTQDVHDLRVFPVHLGLGARAQAQPAFAGMEWYEAYSRRHAKDGAEGRLVAMFDFTDDWESWEMHPSGDEVVLCITGEMTLHQQWPDGTQKSVTIRDGEYAINPAGAWHTADVQEMTTALFITAGEGTQHRPR